MPNTFLFFYILIINNLIGWLLCLRRKNHRWLSTPIKKLWWLSLVFPSRHQSSVLQNFDSWSSSPILFNRLLILFHSSPGATVTSGGTSFRDGIILEVGNISKICFTLKSARWTSCRYFSFYQMLVYTK